MDIRGWEETYPLNGPAWSLFFEYIANILYASWLRKVSNRLLGLLVVLSAALLVHLAVHSGRGDVIGGWSLNKSQLHIGVARLLYPFLTGMLLMRLGGRLHVRHAFELSSVLLVAVFSLPRLGGTQYLWLNGLYEAFAIVVIFPLIVAMGAGEKVEQGLSINLCRWLGDLSYPLYITHYGFIYVYTAWIVRDKVQPAQAAPWGVLLVLGSVATAYAWLKLYDEPVRRWLSSRWLGPS